MELHFYYLPDIVVFNFLFINQFQQVNCRCRQGLIALRQSESGLSFTVDSGLRTLAEQKPQFRLLSVRLRTLQLSVAGSRCVYRQCLAMPNFAVCINLLMPIQLQESSQFLLLALLSVVERSMPKLPSHGHFKTTFKWAIFILDTSFNS